MSLVVVSMLGCKPSKTWDYRIVDQGGHATIVLDSRIQIVVEGAKSGKGVAIGDIVLSGGRSEDTLQYGDLHVVISSDGTSATVFVKEPSEHSIAILQLGGTILCDGERVNLAADDELKIVLKRGGHAEILRE